MSESRFDSEPPKNGKCVELTRGHPSPTPFHVSIWIDGLLSDRRKFEDLTKAESFQREEAAR